MANDNGDTVGHWRTGAQIEERYSDPPAADHYATKEHADEWIEHARTFLSIYGT